MPFASSVESSRQAVLRLMPHASPNSPAVAGVGPVAIAFSSATALSTDCTLDAAGLSARVRAACGRFVPITNTLTRCHSNTTFEGWLDMALSALYRRAQVHDSDVSFVVRTGLRGGW